MAYDDGNVYVDGKLCDNIVKAADLVERLLRKAALDHLVELTEEYEGYDV